MATGDAAKNTPTIASAAQQIYANLVNVLHLGKGAAAGVLGNLQTESGFDPNAYNPRENAHGFAQWEGGRWSGSNGLQAFASQHHLSATSTEAEIGYLDYELTHGYSSVLSQLQGISGSSSSDATNAAQIFQSQFEGSTTASLGDRESNARRILTDIQSGNPLSGGPSSSGSSVAGVGASAGLTAAGFDNTGGGASSIDPAPYDPTTLKGALTAVQRKAIIAWTNGAYIIFKALGEYNGPAETVPDLQAQSDSQLIATYTNFVAWSKVTVKGITGPGADISSIVSGIESWATGIFKKLATWTSDAFLIIVGVIMVILALYIVAKSSGTDVSVAGEGEGGPIDKAAEKTTAAAAAGG